MKLTALCLNSFQLLQLLVLKTKSQEMLVNFQCLSHILILFCFINCLGECSSVSGTASIAGYSCDLTAEPTVIVWLFKLNTTSEGAPKTMDTGAVYSTVPYSIESVVCNACSCSYSFDGIPDYSYYSVFAFVDPYGTLIEFYF